MEDTYKFPGGNDVKVVRKQDIIDCIDVNIVDKEVALAIIKQCECDAISFLRQGKWAGIPFLGSIRANQIKKLENTKEQRELISAAYHTIPKEQYVIFRRNLAHDNQKRLKANKYYKYVLASAINNNRELFKKMCEEKGEPYARIHFCLNKSIIAVGNKFECVDGKDCDY